MMIHGEKYKAAKIYGDEMSEYVSKVYKDEAGDIRGMSAPTFMVAGRMDGRMLKGDIDRPKFIERTHKEMFDTEGKSIPRRYKYCQLKYDGIWGLLVISDGQWVIYSRTGKVKADGVAPINHTACLLGEYIHGKHRIHPKGRFYAFDCLWRGNRDLRDRHYSMRLHHLRNEIVFLSGELLSTEKLINIEEVYTFDRSQWKETWEQYVELDGFEGLVFKDPTATFGSANIRVKSVCEIEYICIGFEPAHEDSKYAGQVGAVRGSLVDFPCDVKCSGLNEKQRARFTANPKKYIGEVFTAKGNGWFPSGSIRHPKFKVWRDDKEITECTYDQIPEAIRES
jgi:ATP-dependent DNA ligase